MKNEAEGISALYISMQENKKKREKYFNWSLKSV